MSKPREVGRVDVEDVEKIEADSREEDTARGMKGRKEDKLLAFLQRITLDD